MKFHIVRTGEENSPEALHNDNAMSGWEDPRTMRAKEQQRNTVMSKMSIQVLPEVNGYKKAFFLWNSKLQQTADYTSVQKLQATES